MKDDKAEGRTGRVGSKLKGVRKRKRARRGFACEVMAYKLRLVKTTKEKGER